MATKQTLTLPVGALKGARFEEFTPAATGAGSSSALAGSSLGPSPTAMVAGSPMSMPMCTPSNVATTVWRTYVCPSAPQRKQEGDGSSLFGSPTSAISAAQSPRSEGLRAGLLASALWAGRPRSAPLADDVSMDSSPCGSVQMPVCTPSDAATTAWRTNVCPNAPMRRQVPMDFGALAPSPMACQMPMSFGALAPSPTNSSIGPADLFPEPTSTPTPGIGAAGCTPQSGILFMPEPRRPLGGRPSFIRTSFDSAPPSASGTPMNNPLNTGFIGTPGSRGGYHMAMDPKSPFFGSDLTPAHMEQVLASATPAGMSEGSKATDSIGMEMVLETPSEERWGQLGA